MENWIAVLICLLIATGSMTVMWLTARRFSGGASSREGFDSGRLEARLEAERRMHEDRIEEMRRQHDRQMEMAMQQMQREMDRRGEELNRNAASLFGRLADEALEENSRRLCDTNATQMESVLSPLRQRLEEFGRSVNEAYVRENATRKSLADQIDRLMQLNMSLGEETRSLASALKGDTRVQGEWGEMVLETLLESAGLKRDVNFFVQVTRDEHGNPLRDDETGRGLRPDVSVMLPDSHRMIIDSKVSLTAYMEYCGASSDDQRRLAAERHCRSVRRHIDELAAKRYQDRFGDAAGHVLMFIPNEGAYFAAVRHDAGLWRYAYDRRVVVVSPTHLFSVMQIVSQLWRQENQNRNAAEIARLGGLLYDKIAAMAAELENVGTRLNDAMNAHARCRDHLVKGGTSIARRAERMRDLGAKVSRQMPGRTRAAIDADKEEEGTDAPLPAQ